jgi:broad specificity phosphatase PhoE
MKEDDALDADLTPLGRRQAEAACEAIAGGSSSLGIQLLVASSLSRAVETAMLAFPEASSPKAPRRSNGGPEMGT